jgi:hypothetical protein
MNINERPYGKWSSGGGGQKEMVFVEWI